MPLASSDLEKKAAFFNLAKTLEQSGQIEQAFEILDKSLASFPTYAKALTMKGNLFLTQDKPSQAIELYGQGRIDWTVCHVY
jgi:tetratricopeptide (TPR) repeat protein